MTLSSADGRIQSGNYCEACYQNLLIGLPTFRPFPNLAVALILGALDTFLVCIASARGFGIGGVSRAIVFAPIVDGVAIGLLLSLQIGLLWRVRGKSEAKTVIAAEKRTSNPRRENLWDSEFDG